MAAALGGTTFAADVREAYDHADADGLTRMVLAEVLGLEGY
ncbi:hypothetical protein [Micromonospora citrea]|nr:hypothetical protein [Micromonospora citrea]